MANDFYCELPLGVPSKKNSKRILTNRATGKPFIASSTAHNAWHRDAMLIMRAAHRGRPALTRCEIKITLIDHGKRKYDLSNKAESILDALVDAGVIIDDNRFCVKALFVHDHTDACVSDCSDGWQIFVEDFS